ncbi:hypothetical protein ACVW1A_000065 [Bradyrhizobium sp. LB1.3]
MLLGWFFRITHGYGSARCRPAIAQDPAAGSPALNSASSIMSWIRPRARLIRNTPCRSGDGPTARCRSFAGSLAPRWSDEWRALAPCILARAGGSLRSAESEINVSAGGSSVWSRQRGGRASADDLGCAWSVARELFVQPAGGPLRPCGTACLFGRAAAQRSDAQPLDGHRDGPARRRTPASRHRHSSLPRHPAREPKASVVDEAGRVLLVGPGGAASGEWQGGTDATRWRDSLEFALHGLRLSTQRRPRRGVRPVAQAPAAAAPFSAAVGELRNEAWRLVKAGRLTP